MDLLNNKVIKASAPFLVIFFLAFQVKGVQTDTILNHKASAIVFQRSLDKPVPPDFYRGKILILDFWATWCAPCIAEFPHFNKLSEKYGSKDVVFATITNEPLPVVSKFFVRTKKYLKAIMLVDTTKTTMNAYNVLTPALLIGIPYCIIIDKDNVVRWAGQTYDLTDTIIENIIQHDRVAARPDSVRKIIKTVARPIASRSLFSFNVARSDTTKHNFEGDGETAAISSSGDIFEFKSANKPLCDLIEEISGYSKSRFITNDQLKLKQLIDINFSIGRDSMRFQDFSNKILQGSAMKNFIISLLSDVFKFNAKIINERRSHYELIVADSAKWHSFKSMNKGHHSLDFDHYPKLEIVGFSLQQIITYVESNANIVINTHVSDNNLYDVSLDVNDVGTLNKSLGFYGLSLIKADDEVRLMDINFY